ncbi:MAG: DUF1553 domain-containing protein [Verrucomicrobia bacterium]|nr:DUF1553 domain-containing protein [Verrucomicrobiota bacterium]
MTRWRPIRRCCGVFIVLSLSAVEPPAFAAGAAREIARPGARLDFPTRILPILTKAGCNAGACHGAAVGQGGFRLSLLGYDPDQDYEMITRELEGRRIDLDQPPASLLLRKPTRELRHKGGRRILKDSADYDTLLGWLAAGAPYGPRELRVHAIQVEPSDLLVEEPGQSVRLRVTASLTDGTLEEVTAHTLFSSNDDAIADVDESGLATVKQPGLTSIMVRYSGQVTAVRIGAPFGPDTLSAAAFQPFNFIDEHVIAELRRIRIPPSALCEESEFLRRVYLDVAGRLPHAAEARAFLTRPPSPPVGASSETFHKLGRDGFHPVPDFVGRSQREVRDAVERVPAGLQVARRVDFELKALQDRRQRVLERLLASTEFIDFWTLKLADLLLVNSKRLGDIPARAYYSWLREQISRNTPVDRLAFALLTAQGDYTTNGPANFHRLTRDARDMGEFASRTFLGIQIACARCHTHPFAGWTQEDYHRFAAYFARTDDDGKRVLVKDHGEVPHPKTGQNLTPKPLGDFAMAQASASDRRFALAQWITSPENRQFARSFVNRVWKQLMGRGLVEPPDDMRVTNPPSNPRLLDALAEYFIAEGCDLRGLIRVIVSSRTYQLSARSNGANRRDDRFFSHALLKPLSGPVLADAIAQASEVADQYSGYPAGTRAVELVDAQISSYSLDVFGRCPREVSCENSSRFGGGLSQALHLINSSSLDDKLRRGIANRLLIQCENAKKIVEELYLAVLSRFPNEQELRYGEEVLAGAANKQTALEDLHWALLNSREFAFNH